jgi:hypothetical protein
MNVPKHSLSILNLVIILLKSQLLQFSMHSIHKFSLKTYHLKYLKGVPEALVNISLIIIMISGGRNSIEYTPTIYNQIASNFF